MIIMTRICGVTAEIELVIKWPQDGKRPPGEEISSMGPTMGKFWSKFDQMSLVDGLLFRSFENEKGDCQHLQLCVPQVFRNEVLEFTQLMVCNRRNLG